MTPLEDFLLGWEAERLMPYRDAAGLWTVGVGHLMQPGDDTTQPITHDEAMALFQTELMDTQARLAALVTVDLSPQQTDGLTAFCFNVGLGAFAGSTMRRCINAGDMNGAAAQFERWSKATVGGQLVTLPGLLKRRLAERQIFIAGDYSGRP